MNLRGLLADHPIAVVFSLAFAVALAATVISASVSDSLVRTLRLGAFTLVLLLFTAGFWAGPVGERYL